MKLLAALVALPALALAGCLAGGPVETASLPAAPDAATGLAALVTHTATGALAALDPAFSDLEVRLEATGFQRGEPTIGVTSDGTIFVPSGSRSIARSSDGGRTWEDVTDPVLGPKADLDPFVYVDPATDRVFHLPLWVGCSWISYSDDLGASWTNNPLGGCGVPAHDHQKLAAGPPREGTTTEGYPNVVYYAYNGAFRNLADLPGPPEELDGTWVSRSLDGGKTFDVGKMVMPADCHSGVNGPVHVSAEGVVYVGSAACDDIQVAVSRDSGLTWEVSDIGEEVGVNPYIAVNPNVATDTEGNAYVVWPGEDALMYMSVSRDEGATWSAPVRVSPPGVTSTAFSVITAGAPGRVTVAYLATDADTSSWETPQAQDAAEDARWHFVMTTSLDALAPEPTFTTVRVTPEDDPAQVGCIWLSGGGSDCRNLLDFIGLVQHEGRAYAVFADGCPQACKDGPDRTGPSSPLPNAGNPRSREAVVAVVERGPDLLDPLGVLAPLV